MTGDHKRQLTALTVGLVLQVLMMLAAVGALWADLEGRIGRLEGKLSIVLSVCDCEGMTNGETTDHQAPRARAGDRGAHRVGADQEGLQALELGARGQGFELAPAQGLDPAP